MWTIQLLGGLIAHSDQRQVTRFRTHKAGALLAYLAFYKDKPPYAREVLADLFWPDADAETGRHNLSAELSPLRRLLEPPGVPPNAVLQADRFTVRLNPTMVTTDVHLFEQAAHRALHGAFSLPERLALLMQAVEWYQGPLLPGYYEDWIEPEATRLRSLYLHMLLCAVPLLLDTRATVQALTYANRAMAEDPLSEQAMKALLQTLKAANQPAQALRSYRAFAQRLKDELDEEPSEELQSRVSQLGQNDRIMTPLALPGGDQPSEEMLKVRPWQPDVDVNLLRTTVYEAAPFTSRGRLRGEGFGVLTTTSFFDREAEIARLSEMLAAPRTRLVTITGPAGTGKTRLALEVASHLANAIDHEDKAPTAAVFVPLADASEAERLYEVILSVLEDTPISGRNPLDQVTELLAAQPDMLLILDNFEQLVEGGAQQVGKLLDYTAVRAPDLRLLITSRRKLQIAGEREFRLAPLPTVGEAQTMEVLLANPSVALFVDRAQAVNPDFKLTERNASAVVQLCNRLEGLPLAIELAAARVQILSPAQILEHIESDRLDFLVSRQRDASARQRTLRATLDWSYRLLPEAGQQMLRQLAVFRGGWTPVEAQAVCALSEAEAEESLLLLRDCSLIGVVDTEDGLRFTMLETIREYAAEQLERSGERDAVCRRHASCFMELVEAISSALLKPEGQDTIRRIGREQENFRAARVWVEANPEDPLHASLGLALLRPWLRLGWSEIARWLDGLRESDTKPEPMANLLLPLAGLTDDLGDPDEAIALLGQLVNLLRQQGKTVQTAWTLIFMGYLAFQRSVPQSRQYLEEALALMRQAGSAVGTIRALTGLAMVVCNQGECACAENLNAELLTLLDGHGDNMVVGNVLLMEGHLAVALDDLPRAGERYERDLALRRRIEDRPGVGVALHFLGVLALCEEDLPMAQSRLDEALTIFRETHWDASYYAAATLCYLGRAHLELGQPLEAEALVREALLRFRRRKNRFGCLPCVHVLAELATAGGQAVRAARLLGACETLRSTLGRVLFRKEREMLERLRASLTTELGAARLAAEMKLGQEMSEEEAMALEETPLSV
jgi:predicted ATPase/DNA-binding SARP family transcriptional activator